ncbi:MAG: large conductance mechanosensitive channel protein MscL [Planctomycetaceae bacterium]
MSLIKEFKDFAMKGNVVDMAVGLIIGAGFGKIVNSMVNDIIMPVVGAFTGGGSLGDRFTYLGDPEKTPQNLDAARKLGEPYIAWGPFVQTTLDFLIVAMSVFLIIKVMNSARDLTKKKEEEAPAAPPAPPEDIVLLREIRDALANR